MVHGQVAKVRKEEVRELRAQGIGQGIYVDFEET